MELITDSIKSKIDPGLQGVDSVDLIVAAGIVPFRMYADPIGSFDGKNTIQSRVKEIDGSYNVKAGNDYPSLLQI